MPTKVLDVNAVAIERLERDNVGVVKRRDMPNESVSSGSRVEETEVSPVGMTARKA